MLSETKHISRRNFLLTGTKTTAGILAAAMLPCQSSPAASAYEDKDAKAEERINMVTWYEVDKSWPSKPDGIVWDNVPGIAVDRDDNVWIFTRSKPPVQVYSPEGKLIRSWGHDLIKSAHYLKIDKAGNVWLSDCGNHTIYKCSREGKVLLTLGTPGQAGNDKTHLDMPTDITFTDNGDLFVSDGYGNRRIIHFDAKGRFIKQWGKEGVGKGEFKLPHAIEIDSTGRLYVADRSNARVQIFDRDGNFIDQWRDLIVPWGFWIDKNDDVWVCGSSPMCWRKEDASFGCPPKDQLIARFNRNGRLLQQWTFPKGCDGKEKSGELNWVHGIAFDSKGNLYLGDIIGKRVQKFTAHTDPKAAV